MLLLQIVILMAIIFGGVLFVLRYILTKNITSATGHLDQLNAEFTRREEEAKKARAEADRYYEEIVNRAKTEAEKLRVETDRELQEARVKILGDARTQSEQIIQKAEKTREMMADEIRKEIEIKILARLKEMVQEIFPERIQQEIHRRWVEDLINGDLSHLAAMRVSEDLKEVKLISAFPLEESQEGQLRKKFKEQLRRDVVFKAETDASLVGGLLITMGSIVLDGTVSNKMEKVIRERV